MPNPVVGEHVGKSIYQKLLLEESTGRAPTVPLPEDFVYTANAVPIPAKENRSTRTIARRLASMRIPSSRTMPSIIPVPSEIEAPKRGLSVRSISQQIEVSVPASETHGDTKSTGLPRVPAVRSIQNRSDFSVPASETLVDKQPTGSPCALIGPTEPFECVPGTIPSDTATTLSRLSATISESIKACIKSSPQALSRSTLSIHTRPHVVKWVDYTNKFGIGYILANGSIGCVFNGTESRASTCILVPDAESHLRRRQDQASYSERHQLVPREGLPVMFLENRGDQGLERVAVPLAASRSTSTKPACLRNCRRCRTASRTRSAAC